jgi:sulfite exporter TauE/SafE
VIDALAGGVAAVVGGLLLGAAGSGHCGAMCGPLVLLANPRAGDGAPLRASARLRHTALYHGGRWITYVALGALAGATGGAIGTLGVGRGLAIAASAALLVQAAAAWHAFRGGAHSPLAARVTRAIGHAGAFMRRHVIAGPAVFGALTGLLPCGLVYAALTAALGLSHPAESAVFMLAFGLGTTPVLAAIGLSADRLRARWPTLPTLARRAAPVVLTAMAILLAVRAIGHSTPHDAAKTAAHGHSNGAR